MIILLPQFTIIFNNQLISIVFINKKAMGLSSTQIKKLNIPSQQRRKSHWWCV